MWRGGVVLLMSVVALSGCKSAGDTKGNDRNPTGIGASRNKNKDSKDAKDSSNPTWLDPSTKLPGADTDVPKAGSWGGDPKSPGFNAKAEAQDSVAGKVVDSFNRPAKDVFVRIEAVNGPPGSAALGIYTDANGYFFTRGLKAGKPYNLTAEATQGGKQLTGSVQTLVPNPVLTIVLREDGAPPITGGTPPKPAPTGTGGEGFPPPPLPSDTDRIPAMGLGGTGGTAPRTPTDGAFSPGGGATRPVPPTIGSPGVPPPNLSPSTGGALPPPDDISVPTTPTKPTRPENVAGTPGNPWNPPPVNIPGPPTLPTYPNPPPPSPAPGTARTQFSLVDPLERPWNFPADRSGSVVLLEFVTTTCVHCKTAVPVLADLQARHGADGLQVIAVLCDEVPLKQRAAAAGKYAQSMNLNFPTYVEAGANPGAVRDKFGVESYPTAVLLDANGNVLWKGHPAAKRRELEAAVRQALGK